MYASRIVAWQVVDSNNASYEPPIPIKFNSKSIFDDIAITMQHSSSASSSVPVTLPFKTFYRHESQKFNRQDIIKHGRSDVTSMHKVIIAVKQLHIDELVKFVEDISNPSSRNFGNFKTRDEIAELTSHATSTAYIVSYLTSFWGGKLVDIEQSSYGDYISGNYLTSRYVYKKYLILS
jgi:hypothetical protein